MPRLSELLQAKTNFILIGETGSGKSEIALNLAVILKNLGRGDVHLFDLDQTKALFRSRDAEEEMRARGITLHYMPQLLDTPVLVNGIIPHLVRKDRISILDVGGNENAARMVGCLSDYLNGESSAALYVLNPYRPWSGSEEDIEATMASVLNACCLEQFFFLANPNVGPGTTEEDVRLSFAKLDREAICGAFVTEDLAPAFREESPWEIYPLHPYLVYPWHRTD